MVSKRLRHLISGFTSVTERITTILTRVKFYNISLICVYAPTEEKDDVVKDVFYSKLEDVYNKCPVHVAKIVLEISTRRSSEKVTLAPLSDSSASMRTPPPTV